MSYVLVNPEGKELRIRHKDAADFFGKLEGAKKILCFPCSKEISMVGESRASMYEIKEFKRKKRVKGTCVIRMGGIGDLVLLSAGLRKMIGPVTLATLPQHVEFARLLNIGNIISIEDVGRFKFDKVIDLRFAVEPKELGGKDTWENYTRKDRAERFMELLGVKGKPEFKMDIPSTENTNLYEEAKFVGINASIMASARALPVDYAGSMTEILANEGHNVVLFGKSNPWNKDLLKIRTSKKVFNLIDGIGVFGLVDLIGRLKMVITPDSGPMHIAGALEKKTLAVFGNIDPQTRVKHYPTVKALWSEYHVPCFDLHPCTGSKDYDPAVGPECMRAISPETIVREALSL